ncbi:MAG: ABC transporter permease [Pseudomonadota bacterium]|nr:ABC transporter permease [Pseudomonadota bacterium]
MSSRLNGALWLGGGLTALVVLTAALSLVWTPHVPAEIDISARFRGVSAAHWLGTDQYGRDILSLLMEGARTSMTVAVISVGAGAAGGVVLGLLASARGGWTDETIMRLSDFIIAFPALLLAIMLGAVFGPSLGVAVLAIVSINLPVFARVTRASANSVWRRDYVTAARAAGRNRLQITLDHILPNISADIVVQATIQFAIAILAEAALSYIGLGTQPPTASWGRMLSEAQTLIYLAPQLAIYPGLCIVIAVLGFNLLGDGLRDRFDPRLARARA